MTYSITIQKTFRAMEGEGFNAKLMCDGRAVALVDDDGCGGCYRYSWNDREAPRVPVTVTRFDGEHVTYQGTPEEAALATHIRTLPPETVNGRVIHVDMDMFVAGLADAALTLRDMRRLMKSKVLFKAGGKLYQIKATLDQRTRNYIAAKHPGAVILNALPEADALALYRQ